MKAALVILDGWALGDHDQLDAVRAATTPTFDRYREEGSFATLETHGRRVGLPEGQMGNSEVGHLNIGAGRVVVQESARITDAIRDGTIAENDAIRSAFQYARRHEGRVHMLGLVSDGGVHSYQAHLHALVELAAAKDVNAIIHAFTDGRDTPPQSGVDYLSELEDVVRECRTGDVATVTGRYYAMDRDENWDRTARAYEAITNRSAPHEAPTAVAAVEQAYQRGDTDEFVEPTIVGDSPCLTDGDAAMFFNFRADRARQLTRMLADIEPTWNAETDPPDIRLVTMTEYDRTFDLPVAFPPDEPTNTLGEILADAGLTQLRIAETEKYAHVTYFLNGGREVEFDGEIRRIIASPDVPTYDLQPVMSAPEVTDTTLDILADRDPDVLILNFANPDMVGHTGDFDAAVAAVEAVDQQLGRLVEPLRQAGAGVMVTADHGNADDMGTPDSPHTAHTTNPVPFIFLGATGESDTDAEHDRSTDRRVREGGTLADVAPTVLDIVGVPKPPEMTGKTLLEPEGRSQGPQPE